ncbi:MAG: hypothetical protein K2H18_07955, partial [Muribaculaceae bacterium]|nr:hypothetical protein [Muribaculaceae bacterium]
MIQEINFTGHTAIPADRLSPDSDLSLSLNLLNEDGVMRPIGKPSIKGTLPDTTTIAFIHNNNIITSNEDSEIFYQSKENYAASEPVKIELDSSAYIKDIIRFDAIGNTLLVFTKTAIHYILWKENKYSYLGDHLPDIGISFGLVGHPRIYSFADNSNELFTISFNPISKDKIYENFSEENQRKITEQVMAKINKFIADHTVNKGRFCFPFLIRYALRLYDGSLTGHSAPVLMNPSTTTCPVVTWNKISGDKDSYTGASLDMMLVAASIDYQLRPISCPDASLLEQWSDIIKSVDIFISKPLYTFDQNGMVESLDDPDNMDSRFIGRLYCENNTEESWPTSIKTAGFPRKDYLY